MHRRLPDHIMEVILGKIGIMYLPMCRSVCTSWNVVIQNYAKSRNKMSPNTLFLCTSFTPSLHFIDLDPKHLAGRSFDASKHFHGDWLGLEIVDSCNSLILVLKYRTHPVDEVYVTFNPRMNEYVELGMNEEYGIMNPMTNEYMKLPISEADEKRGSEFFKYGLGYGQEGYKVVRVYFDEELNRSVFEMLLSWEGKQPNWSCVNHAPCPIDYDGVYSDGAVYWVGVDTSDRECDRVFVYRFDVDSKRMETTLISLTGGGKYTEAFLRTFNGSIYINVLSYSSANYRIELQKMGGGRSSWNREIVVDMPNGWVPRSFPCQLIVDCEDGDTFCLLNEQTFVFFDWKFGSIKPFNNNSSLPISSIGQIHSFNFASLPTILGIHQDLYPICFV